MVMDITGMLLLLIHIPMWPHRTPMAIVTTGATVGGTGMTGDTEAAVGATAEVSTTAMVVAAGNSTRRECTGAEVPD
jgi:hypothetical protein